LLSARFSFFFPLFLSPSSSSRFRFSCCAMKRFTSGGATRGHPCAHTRDQSLHCSSCIRLNLVALAAAGTDSRAALRSASWCCARMLGEFHFNLISSLLHAAPAARYSPRTAAAASRPAPLRPLCGGRLMLHSPCSDARSISVAVYARSSPSLLSRTVVCMRPTPVHTKQQTNSILNTHAEIDSACLCCRVRESNGNC
jgi:hypothetical protein